MEFLIAAIQTFLLIFVLGLSGAICLEMELFKIGYFLMFSAGLSVLLAPALVTMFED